MIRPEPKAGRFGKVRWHGRLSLRLALLLAAMIVPLVIFAPLLYERVLALCGLPASDALFIIDSPDNDQEDAATKVGFDPVAERFDLLAELVAFGAKPDSSGRLHPTDEALEALNRSLHDYERFVWIGPQERVLAASSDLPWEVGSSWPHGLESHSDVAVWEEEKAHAIYVPVSVDGGRRGTFVALALWDRLPADAGLCTMDSDHAEPNAGTVVMTEEEFARTVKLESRIATGLVIALVFLIVLLLALATTRWVTRRLTRLAAAAAQPVTPTGGLPGPFDETGNDEIAVLARAMNSMRSRAAELLEDLSARDAARREWIAHVSHDLRTPLTALLACLDRAEMTLDGADPLAPKDQMHRLLQVARLDADRVQSLADDLFEIARLEGGDALVLEPVPPAELVRQSIAGFGPLAQAKDVVLDVSVSPNLPLLKADGQRLMRALENLLRNAVHYARSKVRISVVGVDGGVRFEVQDDGPGFPLDNGRVVVSELHKRSPRDGSTGLGLKVASRVAEVHHGKIGAHNTPAGGAAVWLLIPVDEHDAQD